MHSTAPGHGRFFYLIGASGVGKDSLIAYARDHVGDAPLIFAHRYITRPAEATGEQHVPLSEAEFARRRDAGLFALHWTGNGLHYGIGIEVDSWLARGLDVVANGSRAHLEPADRRFPGLHPILVEAPPERIAQRLAARGRESADEIAARIARAHRLARPTHPRLRVICNDGPLADAGEALLGLLKTPPPADRSADRCA